MTEAQANFVALEKVRKKLFEDFDAALLAVKNEVGIGGHFQDSDGVVYKLIAPEGKWVKFDSVSYVRTKREGERQGTLSAVAAKELGYEV